MAQEARFLRLSGPEQGATVAVKGTVRIGSTPGCELSFPGDPHVAPVHAKVVLDKGSWWLFDNVDGFSTFVNGVLIQRAQLEPGDELTFGENGPKVRFDVEQKASSEDARPRGTATFSPSLVARGTTAQTLDAGDLGEGKRLELAKPELEIGRDSQNDIVLDHPSVTSFHAAIVKDGDGCAVLDKRSTNGTFVNGARVGGKRRLAPNDVVSIGPFHLVHRDGAIYVHDERKRSELSVVHVTRDVGGGLKLLDDVSLRIRSGELVGLLGPSGAGKSTLLLTLNGLRPATSGRVLVNGVDLYDNYDALKTSIGFVPQDDIIHLELTAERTLEYVSRLRLPPDLADDERRKIIAKTLGLLELTERKDIPIKRLSGGQRKRVSLGVELLTEPSLIFLDEPTAGLDPALEGKMMVLFKELAKSGKTVVVTTHVMENVDLFDKLVVLVKGKLAFIGSPAEARAHFGIADMRGLYDKLATATADDWRNRFTSTKQFQENVAPAASATVASGPGRALRKPPRGIIQGARQLGILAQRYVDILGRDRRNTALLLAQAPIVAIFIALAMDSAALILFMLSLTAVWFGTSNAAKEIVKEWPVYRRERAVNLRIGPYVLSKALVLSAIAVAQCFLLVAVVMAIRHVAGNPVEIFAAVLLSSVAGIASGLAISSFVETTDKATALVPLALIPQVLFSGVFTPLTGLTGGVGMVMPTRWSYDLLKRTVMASHKEKAPPLIDFDEKKVAEAELAVLESRSRAAVASIDAKSRDARAIGSRLTGLRSDAERDIAALTSQQTVFLRCYERALVQVAEIEKQDAVVRGAVAREREIADATQKDLNELQREVGRKPPDTLFFQRFTPEWVEERKKRFEEAAASWKKLETALSTVEKAGSSLLEERKAAETSAREVRALEEALVVDKKRFEEETAQLVVIVQDVSKLEEQLKADATRVQEIQLEVTEHLRQRRYVYLDASDSVGKDGVVLAFMCVVFGIGTIVVLRKRDSE